jgi:hypothetical protein
MLRKPTIALVMLALAGGLPFALTRGPAAAASAKPPATRAGRCSTTGARWTWGRQNGDRYRVYPDGTTCSFAQHWSAQLSHKRPVFSGGMRVIRGGPAGWTCATRFPVRFPRAWAGTCSKGNRGFGWLPLLPASAGGP